MSTLIYFILLLTFITDTFAANFDAISNSTVSSTEDPPAFNVSGNPVVFALVYSFALFVIFAVFITPTVICAISACSRD